MATTTLAQTLAKDRVEFSDLQEKYSAVLSLVSVLIGVVPNCDRYLEIWPPGFRTYNIMVPNFLNLPASLFGFAGNKKLQGLAMYTSSRAASCAYCSAHTCSFALRRGTSPDSVTGANRSDIENAVVAVAEALSSVPDKFESSVKTRLTNYMSATDAEWIVLSIAMMGFLNKFMDAVGVELESQAIDDVANLIEPTGWSSGQHAWALGAAEKSTATDKKSLPPRDSLLTYLRVLRRAPGAIKLNRQWIHNTPKKPAAAREFIHHHFGFDENLLTTLQHQKPIRALAAMLQCNLDPAQSQLGVANKAMAGITFAQVTGSAHLNKQCRALAIRHGVSANTLATLESEALANSGELDPTSCAVLHITQAISPSPAVVNKDSLDMAKAHLGSAQIVELAVWVSLCQLLHRLHLYYD